MMIVSLSDYSEIPPPSITNPWSSNVLLSYIGRKRCDAVYDESTTRPPEEARPASRLSIDSEASFSAPEIRLIHALQHVIDREY